ncbi:MAG TPA: biliverdin-producing heme oxygenase [Burkholderiales bacterium]|nr:biliverdin-producing heme oxygenase [Burkholderiales bacterium]
MRARLKAETRALHDQAERTGVMQRILCGRFVRTDYCALLRNLREIYAALEPALERHANHPLVAPIAFSRLFRLAHIERDLHDLHGPDWSHDFEVKHAATQYKERLETLSATHPALLSAHAYVRRRNTRTSRRAVRSATTVFSSPRLRAVSWSKVRSIPTGGACSSFRSRARDVRGSTFL